MAISEWIERLGEVIFESPFGGAQLTAEAPELAELRLAVLDAIKDQSHRVAGKQVFPHNRIHVRLLGIPRDKSAMFESGFLGRFLESELRGGLDAANVRFPEDLQVELETTPDLPGPKERWLSVRTESRATETAAPQVRRAARLVVEKGTANQSAIVLSKARTNLGRTADVYRSTGPSRRNDLAFTEENEVNKTVSREHAHILYDKRSGEYRLFNDRWYTAGKLTDGECGLWIIRDGLSLEVHRNARGVRLEPGDEIHLGRAVLRFVVK